MQHIATWMHRHSIGRNIFLFINMNVCLFTCNLCCKEIQSNLLQHTTTHCYFATWTHRRNITQNGSSLWAFMQLVNFSFQRNTYWLPATYCKSLQHFALPRRSTKRNECSFWVYLWIVSNRTSTRPRPPYCNTLQSTSVLLEIVLFFTPGYLASNCQCLQQDFRKI